MRFVALDYDTARKRGDEILDCSRDVSDWTSENLLRDLPGKWKMSFLVIEGEEIIGYVILSVKFGWPHIHQFMIRRDWRSRNIGRAMIHKISDTYSHFSLKIHPSNGRAIRFYERNGLVVTDDVGDYIWMESGDRAKWSGKDD